MQKVGIWHLSGDKPKKLQESKIDFEQYLEEWIETDPEFLQVGLTIVGKQISVEGGRLDLLAIDPQGRWVIIEIKREQLRREVIAQIIDYASSLAAMPDEEFSRKIDDYLQSKGTSIKELLDNRDAHEVLEIDNREFLLFVVGTKKAPGLGRMVSFLSERFNIPISLVTYDVYEISEGQQILTRELTESDDVAIKPKDIPSIEQTCELAEKEGIGTDFKAFLEVAENFGLHKRPYKNSIMYAPPSKKTRVLFTVWAKPSSGLLWLYVSPKAIAEFYPISEEEAKSYLGEDGYRKFNSSETKQFIEKLNQLFQSVEQDNL
jgi:hypothetical protein